MPRRRNDPESNAAQTVGRVLNETRAGLDAHNERTRRFDRSYEVWRSPDRGRPRGMEDWESVFKVKYGMQTADQLLVSMAQNVPAPKCTPRNEASVAKARAMEQVLTYYADQAHIAEKVAVVTQQALVYNVSPGKTRWLYKEADRSMNMPSQDAAGMTVWTPGRAKIIECDRPDFIPWDAYDCFWEPSARDVDTAAYVVLRCWPSKDELMRNEYNEVDGTGTYRNLELLFSSGPGEQKPQSAQNLLLDQQPTYRDRFEVWEIWRDDRLTVIGNRQILLYDGPKPYWMPGKPVTISHTRPDFFRIEGISEMELVDHLQQWLQSQDNLRYENQRVTVQRPLTARNTVDPKRIDVSPRGITMVDDHDDIQPLVFPPLPREAYEEHATLLAALRDVTGVNAYVTGAGPSALGADQNTATGVTLLTQAASKLLVFKAQLVANLTWSRMYQQWGDLTRQFLRRDIEVMIRGRGDQWLSQTYGPQDVFGDYDIRIETAEESLNKQQRQTRTIALLNALAPFAQSGMVSLAPLLREVAEAFEFPHPDMLIPDQPVQPPAAPNVTQFPSGPAPLERGGMLAPEPQMSILAGNSRGG